MGESIQSATPINDNGCFADNPTLLENNLFSDCKVVICATVTVKAAWVLWTPLLTYFNQQWELSLTHNLITYQCSIIQVVSIRASIDSSWLGIISLVSASPRTLREIEWFASLKKLMLFFTTNICDTRSRCIKLLSSESDSVPIRCYGFCNHALGWRY